MERKIILEVKGLSKHFGGVRAVDNIDFKLYENEIVGIVGDNGAGKSTFIKIISGVYRKDSGKIYINGDEVDILDTNSAKRYGIETVYQDKGLIHNFDAASNLFLGREKFERNILGKLLKFVDFRYMKKETKRLLERIGIVVKDINAPVGDLSGGQQQGITVGRAVYWGGEIIIFDEPTNNLGVKEQKKVVNLIKQLRDNYNISIIIIAHDMYHIFELTDRIIVLRNGKKVGERIKKETTQNEIVSLITGASV